MTPQNGLKDNIDSSPHTSDKKSDEPPIQKISPITFDPDLHYLEYDDERLPTTEEEKEMIEKFDPNTLVFYFS